MFWSLKNLCDFYRLQGKLYVYRPVKSKKKLLAEWVINSALKSGELKHGQAVAEITAGNFGIALAEQCRKTGSKLFVIPLGVFSKKTEEKLKSFDNVEIVETKNSFDFSVLKEKLEQTICEHNAYSFRQFGNTKQIDFYKNLLGDVFDGIKIDAVFEKVGTGATLRAVREKLAENGCFADCFVAKPDERKIQTDHLIFSTADVGFVWPHDKAEYKNNFEKVLWDTERLSELNYAKLSLFCAVEWMKNNPRKNAFVFIGD